MSKIDARAARLTKQNRRLPTPPIPLDFAQFVAQRRANGVSEYKAIEESNHLQHSIQKAIELENQFTERHKMEDRLRLGGLPASISHPIAAAMVRPNAPAPMEVDEVMMAPNHDGQTYQTTTRETDRNLGIPNLEDYTRDEDRLMRGTQMGNDVVRSYNIKVQAKNAQFTRREGLKAAKAARDAARAAAAAAHAAANP